MPQAPPRYKQRLALAAGLAVALGAGALAARPLEQHFGAANSCYARSYSADHLGAHPDQKVASIRFDHFPTTYGTFDAQGRIAFDPDKPELYFVLTVTFRDKAGQFSNSGFCWPEGDSYHCALECDAGQFFLRDRSAQSILITGGGDLYLSGCDGGNAGVLKREPDDKVFRLDRLADADCQPPD